MLSCASPASCSLTHWFDFSFRLNSKWLRLGSREDSQDMQMSIKYPWGDQREIIHSGISHHTTTHDSVYAVLCHHIAVYVSVCAHIKIQQHFAWLLITAAYLFLGPHYFESQGQGISQPLFSQVTMTYLHECLEFRLAESILA